MRAVALVLVQVRIIRRNKVKRNYKIVITFSKATQWILTKSQWISLLFQLKIPLKMSTKYKKKLIIIKKISKKYLPIKFSLIKNSKLIKKWFK
mgnify:CR=1 FL=1